MHLPTLVSDLALILICAAAMSLLFKKLKQPVILGYIVAGFLASPSMPYFESIVDADAIKTWAEIGVFFLLFSLGLEFSFKKLMKIGGTPIIATILILVSMIVIGIGVAEAFEWGFMNGLYLGGMIAMSSTSIIIKALEDLGLKQKKFTSLVFSVLILEDLIAIVLMILFGTLGQGGEVDGEKIFRSIVSMIFYLVIWFVSGIYLVPLLLKKAKSLLNNETLLIVSLALCFLMVCAASLAGFSAAFGAFVMGSILAETTESDKIERITAPIKNLFGAIFFVSVGMMIQPAMLIEYWLPIVVVTLVVLVLRTIVSIFSFIAGGTTLRTSVECSMSLAPVGEFSFILATLGISLGAISNHIYPIIVSVSVITTFVTPYMIKLSTPLADKLEPLVPVRFRRALERNEAIPDSSRMNKAWKDVLQESATTLLIYGALSVAVIEIGDYLFYPWLASMIDETWARVVTLILTLAGLMPFLYPLALKGLYDSKFKKLWSDTHFNRAPLVFLVVFRVLIVITLLIFAIHKIYSSPWLVVIGTLIFIVTTKLLSTKLNLGQEHMENVFLENLNSKESRNQHYAKELMSRNIHLSEVEMPINSIWCGKSIRTCNWGHIYGVHIASIIRESGRLNIPSPDTPIFPGDKIQLIGTDEQLTAFAAELKSKENMLKVKETTADNIMEMMRITIPEGSYYIGQKIKESNIRNDFRGLIVGIDRGDQELQRPTPEQTIQSGDLLWVVGEISDIKNLQLKANEMKEGPEEAPA